MHKHARPWWRDEMRKRPGGRDHDSQWWREAVIYQICPWSFQDSTGSGTGDLGGIISRLDYINSLGVDAIWLTPINTSPMDDLGYDITDLCAIGSAFGDMDQFRLLLDLAHRRGLRVLLDGVWNHTSEQHPWFVESRGSRCNPRSDWYLWADPAPDGGPPNNWRSAFSGVSGWHLDDMRGQYYWASFLPSQPDLNWHHPEVRATVLTSMRFWLDLGVDGFRVDAVNFFTQDPELRDNPPRRRSDRRPDGVALSNPLARQLLVNSFNRDETFDYLAPMRQLVDEYPGTVLLGEVTLCEDSVKLAAAYTRGPRRLQMAYHSGLLSDAPLRAPLVRELVDRVLSEFGDSGACWIVGNHDYGRLRTQWGGKKRDLGDDFYRMVATLLVCLPGALVLWQGDELGLPEAKIPGEIRKRDLKDPFGKLLYPKLKGRDGSRTPMPWDDRLDHGGFTTGTPWLPVPPRHLARSVRLQDLDPDSLLNHWRQLLSWRRGQPALQYGTTELLSLRAPLLGLLRRAHGQRLVCVFNLSARTVGSSLPGLPIAAQVNGLVEGAIWDGKRLTLPPWGVFLAQLEA